MIKVTDFHKVYEQTVAVDGIGFSVESGQVLGLIGPNGAGKTTTLRALTGMIPASHGTLEVAGFDIEQRPLDARKALAYIPDDPQLFPDLTVAQHLAFTASAYQVFQAGEIAADLLHKFQLIQKQNTPARELSRGMRQKLAVCCAYLHSPSAILFDEPLTGLDPHGIRMLKESIQERAAAGAAVIVSSHLLAMVEDICSHVLILDEGQMRFVGPLDQLRSQFNVEANASLEQVFFQATGSSESRDRRDALTAAGSS